MLSDSAALNAAIVAVVSIVTLILRWLFSRHDTAYENMQRESRQQAAHLDWCRAVIVLLDDESWSMWTALNKAGIEVRQRKDWPPRPKPEDWE